MAVIFALRPVGLAEQQVLVLADFDGDGRADVAESSRVFVSSGFFGTTFGEP